MQIYQERHMGPCTKIQRVMALATDSPDKADRRNTAVFNICSHCTVPSYRLLYENTSLEVCGYKPSCVECVLGYVCIAAPAAGAALNLLALALGPKQKAV